MAAVLALVLELLLSLAPRPLCRHRLLPMRLFSPLSLFLSFHSRFVAAVIVSFVIAL